MSSLLVVAIGAPALAGLVLLGGSQHLLRRLPASVGLGPVAALVSAFLVGTSLWQPAETFSRLHWQWLQLGTQSLDLGWELTKLNAPIALVVLLAAFLIQLYSLGYAAHDARYPELLGYLSLFTAAMLGLVLSDGLLSFFLSWEWMGLLSYLLIGFYREKPAANRASLKAFLTTRLGDAAFLVGLAACFSLFGSLGFSELNAQIPTLSWQREVFLGMPAPFFVGLCFVIATLGKSAQFPLHFWLPDAMEGPTPVSALIHAATMVAAGILLLAKLFPLLALSPGLLDGIAFIGLFTALLAALCACAETQLKRVLALSTISQLGYMLAAIGLGSPAAALLHLTTHAFFKAGLFLAAGILIHLAGTGDLRSLRLPIARRKEVPGSGGSVSPALFLGFLLCLLALCGLPLTSGFLSKERILLAALESKHWFSASFAFATVFCTAFYCTRLAWMLFFSNSDRHAPSADVAHAVSPTRWETAATLTLAGLSLSFWFWPLLGHPGFVVQSTQAQAPLAHTAEALSLSLIAAGIFCAWCWRRKFGLARKGFVFWVRSGFGWNHLWAGLFAGSLVPKAAATTAQFDDLVVDRCLVDGTKDLALVLRRAADWSDTQLVDRLGVDGLAGLARRLGSLLRRFQSANLQQYAFGALALLVIFIWWTTR